MDRVFPLSLFAVAVFYAAWVEAIWHFVTAKSRILTSQMGATSALELLTTTWDWFHFDVQVLGLAAVPATVALFALGLRGVRRKSAEAFLTLHLLMVSAGILASTAFSVVLPRYFLMVLPLYLLLLGRGFSLAARKIAAAAPVKWRTPAYRGLAVLGLLMGCCAIPSLYRYQKKDIMPWRSAAALLREKAQAGDPILPGIFMSRTALEYYLPQASGAQVRLLPFAETDDDLRLTLDREPRIWFATSFWDRLPAWYRSVIEDQLPLAIRVEGLEPYGDIVIRYRE